MNREREREGGRKRHQREMIKERERKGGGGGEFDEKHNWDGTSQHISSSQKWLQRRSEARDLPSRQKIDRQKKKKKNGKRS